MHIHADRQSTGRFLALRLRFCTYHASMNATLVLMLHAETTHHKSVHKFVELFTSNEKLEAYLTNHPEVKKIEVTLHELDKA